MPSLKPDFGLQRFFFLLYRRLVSPALHSLFGSTYGCRFIPSCSEYAEEAFTIHGFRRGGFLTIKRLCRCHPFTEGGIDPVPLSIPPASHLPQTHGIGASVSHNLIMSSLNDEPGR